MHVSGRCEDMHLVLDLQALCFAGGLLQNLRSCLCSIE